MKNISMILLHDFYKKRCIGISDMPRLEQINELIAVLGIRIRMFLGLPDPDSLVRGKDPDPAPDPSLFS